MILIENKTRRVHSALKSAQCALRHIARREAHIAAQ